MWLTRRVGEAADVPPKQAAAMVKILRALSPGLVLDIARFNAPQDLESVIHDELQQFVATPTGPPQLAQLVRAALTNPELITQLARVVVVPHSEQTDQEQQHQQQQHQQQQQDQQDQQDQQLPPLSPQEMQFYSLYKRIKTHLEHHEWLWPGICWKVMLVRLTPDLVEELLSRTVGASEAAVRVWFHAANMQPVGLPDPAGDQLLLGGDMRPWIATLGVHGLMRTRLLAIAPSVGLWVQGALS